MENLKYLLYGLFCVWEVYSCEKSLQASYLANPIVMKHKSIFFCEYTF